MRWGIRAAVARHDRHARRRALAVLVDDVESEFRLRRPVVALRRHHVLAGAAQRLDHAQRGVAVAVVDDGDARAVRRPARVAAVERAEAQRQRRGAVGGGQPQLLVLAAVVAGIEQAPAVRRQLGPRAPAGFLAQHAATLRGMVDIHGEDVAGAPADLRVADVVDRPAVGRPGRIDGVVEGRVVVAVQRALALAQQQVRVVQAGGIDVGEEQVEVAGALSRHPGEPLAIRRQPRLHVHRALVGEALLAAAGEIQSPQLQRVAVVAGEHHAAPVVRRIGLVVVGGLGMGQFGGAGVADALAPQRAAHAVDERVAVGQEAG